MYDPSKILSWIVADKCRTLLQDPSIVSDLAKPDTAIAAREETDNE